MNAPLDTTSPATGTDTPPRWDMTSLYPSLDSVEFKSGFEAAVGQIRELQSLFDAEGVGGLPETPVVDAGLVARFERVTNALNATLDNVRTVRAYISAFVATDSRDEAAQGQASELRREAVPLSILSTRYTAWLGSLDVDGLIAASPLAADHAYYLREAKVAATHLLSPGEEELAADLYLSGSAGWGRLYNDYTSQITVPFERKMGDNSNDPELLLQQAQEEMRAVHARNRERAVQAITQKNNLQFMVDDQQKKVNDLQAKSEKARLNGDLERALQLSKEKQSYETALEMTRANLEQATETAEAVKKAIKAEEEKIRQKTAEALALKAQWKNAQIRIEMDKALSGMRGVERIDESFTLAQEKIQNAVSEVEARSELAKLRVENRLRDLELAEKGLAVEVITLKNHLQQMVEDQQKKVDTLQAKADLALKRGDPDLSEQLLKEKTSYETALQDTRANLEQAMESVEDMKKFLMDKEGINLEEVEARIREAYRRAARIQSEMGTAVKEIQSSSQGTGGVRSATENLPISVIRALASDPDRDVRRRAYEAELAAWKGAALPLAACMNGIKQEASVLARRRGWGTPLESALFNNHIDRATLDAMLTAAYKSFPDFRRYLRAKAKLVSGDERLPWYDLFAPVGGGGRVWTWPAAESFVAEQFGRFSPKLEHLARRAFDERWIDAEPRPGKRDGAFCMGVRADESRILQNYKPAFGAVSTLAHELGHAYHNTCIAGRTPLQRSSPMTLNETASIFCETIIRAAALERAEGGEGLEILEASLTGYCQVVVDITSRFLFEKGVVERRARRELSVDELCGLMRDAQLETYGDGLDENFLHPYMWAAKPHYYGSSFYNYPYMFGLLFGLGLYAIYQKDPDNFKARYDDLLSRTGMADAAELAGTFGIDIREESFWSASLDVIRKDIIRFEELVG